MAQAQLVAGLFVELFAAHQEAGNIGTNLDVKLAHRFGVKHGVETGNLPHLQCIPKLIEGTLIADVIAALGSMDFVLGDTDR